MSLEQRPSIDRIKFYDMVHQLRNMAEETDGVIISSKRDLMERFGEQYDVTVALSAINDAIQLAGVEVRRTPLIEEEKETPADADELMNQIDTMLCLMRTMNDRLVNIEKHLATIKVELGVS